jgi:hypothetical protein
MMPETITIDITDSNEIEIPLEWLERLRFGMYGARYVQITLVDDRIVIHKPLTAGVEYNAPCKAGDDSYIRSIGLFNVKIPKQFFKQIGLEDGGKADLILEDNCVLIRKNKDVAPIIPEPEPLEPIMAFCCVCGHLLYTGGGIVRVLEKYICHRCVELVKAL